MDRELISRLTLIRSKKILLNSVSSSEVLTEADIRDNESRHKYSAKCTTSIVIVYAIEKNRVLTFPRHVIDTLKETHVIKEAHRIDKFQKDIKIQLKLLEFIDINPRKMYHIVDQRNESKFSLMKFQRISSIDKYAHARDKLYQSRSINGKASTKADVFLYDMGERLLIMADKTQPLTCKSIVSNKFFPMRKLVQTCKNILRKNETQLINAFRIVKQEPQQLSHKIISLRGMKLSFKT